MTIEWKILDIYQKLIYTTTTTSTSDKFALKSNTNKEERNGVFENALKDAVEVGFIQLIKSSKVQEILKDNSEQKREEALKELTITSSKKYVSSLGESIKSSVTIKTKDGHGSGFIISSDGYIVTNYHVISDDSKLTVVLNNGSEYTPEVIRSSKVSDLALLKIKAQDLIPFSLNSSKELEVATEIYAIGTPTGQDLSQTISKGIISGVRNLDHMKLIQIDASVNAGNSGGAIVNKEGLVLGVVSAKIMGIGIEGVGFGIPAYEILNRLKIIIK